MPGVSLGITLPTVGVTAGPTWATNLNTAIQTIIDDIEAQIVPSEINVNDTFDMNNQAVIDIDRIRLDDRGGDPTASRSVYCNADELYFKDGAGNVVQLTDSGAINSASIGGINGDYGSAGVDADVSYFTATTFYTFTQDTTFPAGIDCGPVRIKEDTSGITKYVGLSSPASLAATYTLELPDALPGSANKILGISTAGKVDVEDDPSVGSVTTSGNITCGGTISVSGDVDCAGELKHGNIQHNITALGINDSATPSDWLFNASSGIWFVAAAGSILVIPLHLPAVSRVIDEIVVRLNKADTGTFTARVKSMNVSGTLTNESTAATTTTSGAVSITMSSLAITIDTNKAYMLYLTSAAAADQIRLVKATYDYP